MREIKFRAKEIHDREWVFGYYVNSNGHLIHEGGYGGIWIVDEKTICQYTGLKDKNGVEIYEGDVLKLWRSVGLDNSLRGEYKSLPVVYDENWCQFVVIDHELKIQYGFWQQFGAFEVIGNIHDKETI